MTTPQAPEAPPSPFYDIVWLQNLSFVGAKMTIEEASGLASSKSSENPDGDFLVVTARMTPVMAFRAGQRFVLAQA